jgi:hypothetical protein
MAYRDKQGQAGTNMNYIKDSRLSLEIEATFKDNLSEDDASERMSAFVSAAYKSMDPCVSKLATNRIDGFPGSNRYDLCEDDGEVHPSGDGSWSGVIELYGEGDWVTEAVARDVKSLFVVEFDMLIEKYGVERMTIKQVRAIRAVVSNTTEILNV